MRRSNGFTLIEIVIVVGIIGLLMVVLVPSITSSWNTNVMKGARLQAERVAKSIRMGILSGDIQTSTDLGYWYDHSNPSEGPINISGNYIHNIEGIETLYENPKDNEDLKDPTDADKRELRVKYISDKIQIWNAEEKELFYQEP